MEVRATFRCPKCGNYTQEKFARAHGKNHLTCGACSHTADAEQFYDAATRKRILEAAQKLAVDKLKKVPGFKPR